MSATGTVSVVGTVEDLPTGTKSITPPAISAPAAIAAEVQLELASGDNTIDVPAGATVAIVAFDQDSTTIKTLKGAGGDTGLILGTIETLMLPVVGETSFIINSSAADDDGEMAPTPYTTTVLFV